jgi:4-hydroxybenzoate polyprenyltransferase
MIASDKIRAYARLVRFPNLIIVVLTQYLLQYAILLPAILPFGQQPILPDWQFGLLVFSTVLIAAGGYVVNDIEDIGVDAINKPEYKQIVGRVIPLSIAWQFYQLLTLLGFGVSLYLALYIHDFIQLLLYPIAVFMLYAYSRWWKRQVLIGNVVVAFFCAFVAWVVYYAQDLSSFDCAYIYQTSVEIEKDSIWKYCEKARTAYQSIFIVYALFAFISTLFREIIKDIEDTQGDSLGNCRTLPILIGIKPAQMMAFGVGVFFLILIVIVSFLIQNGEILFTSLFVEHLIPWHKILILNLMVSLPLVYTLYKLALAKTKEDFGVLSKWAKGIMLSGLFFILIARL